MNCEVMSICFQANLAQDSVLVKQALVIHLQREVGQVRNIESNSSYCRPIVNT